MQRILPELTPETRFFWEAGASGVLRFLCCKACGNYVHPPVPVCNVCLARHPQPKDVSGRARVASFTVNPQRWSPDLAVPYVVALVEIDEQPSLRLTTNIVNCEPCDLHIGMPVRVTFMPVEDVFLPLFEPERGSRDDA